MRSCVAQPVQGYLGVGNFRCPARHYSYKDTAIWQGFRPCSEFPYICKYTYSYFIFSGPAGARAQAGTGAGIGVFYTYFTDSYFLEIDQRKRRSKYEPEVDGMSLALGLCLHPPTC